MVELESLMPRLRQGNTGQVHATWGLLSLWNGGKALNTFADVTHRCSGPVR